MANSINNSAADQVVEQPSHPDKHSSIDVDEKQEAVTLGPLPFEYFSCQ